jgi:hypothetical protein
MIKRLNFSNQFSSIIKQKYLLEINEMVSLADRQQQKAAYKDF